MHPPPPGPQAPTVAAEGLLGDLDVVVALGREAVVGGVQGPGQELGHGELCGEGGGAVSLRGQGRGHPPALAFCCRTRSGGAIPVTSKDLTPWSLREGTTDTWLTCPSRHTVGHSGSEATPPASPPTRPTPITSPPTCPHRPSPPPPPAPATEEEPTMATCGSLACRLEEMWLMTTSTVSIRPSTTALSWQRQRGARSESRDRCPRRPRSSSHACSAVMGPREEALEPTRV